MPIRQQVIRMRRKLSSGSGTESGVETIAEDSPLTQKDINKNGLSASRSSRKRSSVSRSKSGRSSSSMSSRNNNKSSSSASTDPTSTSSSSSRDPSRKAVHWNPKVGKKRHIQLQDMRDYERESVWYNEDDSRIILAMARVTVKMMMKGEACDDIDYCSRGLEGKTLSGSKKRSKNKNLVRAAVLTEQEIQRMDGVHDPEELANVSVKCSVTICTVARDKGIQDEQAIQDYLDDVRIRIHRDCLMTKRIAT